jgi:hypothetical protein
MAKHQAVQGSAKKGFRKIGNPSVGTTPPEPGIGTGPGAFGDGGDNVKGNAGNGGPGGLKSGDGFPASGSGRAPGQVSG